MMTTVSNFLFFIGWKIHAAHLEDLITLPVFIIKLHAQPSVYLSVVATVRSLISSDAHVEFLECSFSAVGVAVIDERAPRCRGFSSTPTGPVEINQGVVVIRTCGGQGVWAIEPGHVNTTQNRRGFHSRCHTWSHQSNDARELPCGRKIGRASCRVRLWIGVGEVSRDR